MKIKTGLWIDHRKAVIISITDNGETVKVINSEIEKHLHASGGSHAGGFKYGISAEDSIDRRFQQHLGKYYDKVISSVMNSDAIFIFGPGEAKHEFESRINQNKSIRKSVIGIETTDKMTDHQIAAKVRKIYQTS